MAGIQQPVRKIALLDLPSHWPFSARIIHPGNGDIPPFIMIEVWLSKTIICSSFVIHSLIRGSIVHRCWLIWLAQK
jgi:hypothetical protein